MHEIDQLNAAVLRAISKQSGMSFIPATQRRVAVDGWIKSLTKQQKIEIIAVVEECHDEKHPSYHTVNDALSLILMKGMTNTIFAILRYREAFASPWKLEHGSYTPTMRYINGIWTMTSLDIMDCTEEEFSRTSAVLRYAHDVSSNPDLQEMNTILVVRNEAAAGGVYATYSDPELFSFVWEHYDNVDDLVRITATRKTDDMGLMRAFIEGNGSRALIDGIL